MKEKLEFIEDHVDGVDTPIVLFVKLPDGDIGLANKSHIESAVKQARINEIELIQHTKWVDISYDISGYLKDRITTLKGGE